MEGNGANMKADCRTAHRSNPVGPGLMSQWLQTYKPDPEYSMGFRQFSEADHGARMQISQQQDVTISQSKRVTSTQVPHQPSDSLSKDITIFATATDGSPQWVSQARSSRLLHHPLEDDVSDSDDQSCDGDAPRIEQHSDSVYMIDADFTDNKSWTGTLRSEDDAAARIAVPPEAMARIEKMSKKQGLVQKPHSQTAERVTVQRESDKKAAQEAEKLRETDCYLRDIMCRIKQNLAESALLIIERVGQKNSVVKCAHPLCPAAHMLIPSNTYYAALVRPQGATTFIDQCCLTCLEKLWNGDGMVEPLPNAEARSIELKPLQTAVIPAIDGTNDGEEGTQYDMSTMRLAAADITNSSSQAAMFSAPAASFHPLVYRPTPTTTSTAASSSKPSIEMQVNDVATAQSVTSSPPVLLSFGSQYTSPETSQLGSSNGGYVQVATKRGGERSRKTTISARRPAGLGVAASFGVVPSKASTNRPPLTFLPPQTPTSALASTLRSTHISKPKKSRAKKQPKQVWCLCRLPDDGNEMIQCTNNSCSIGWFHVACILGGVTKLDDNWLCPTCRHAEPMMPKPLREEPIIKRLINDLSVPGDAAKYIVGQPYGLGTWEENLLAAQTPPFGDEDTPMDDYSQLDGPTDIPASLLSSKHAPSPDELACMSAAPGDEEVEQQEEAEDDDDSISPPPTRFQYLSYFIKAGASLTAAEKAAVKVWRASSQEQLRVVFEQELCYDVAAMPGGGRDSALEWCPTKRGKGVADAKGGECAGDGGAVVTSEECKGKDLSVVLAVMGSRK